MPPRKEGGNPVRRPKSDFSKSGEGRISTAKTYGGRRPGGFKKKEKFAAVIEGLPQFYNGDFIQPIIKEYCPKIFKFKTGRFGPVIKVFLKTEKDANRVVKGLNGKRIIDHVLDVRTVDLSENTTSFTHVILKTIIFDLTKEREEELSDEIEEKGKLILGDSDCYPKTCSIHFFKKEFAEQFMASHPTYVKNVHFQEQTLLITNLPPTITTTGIAKMIGISTQKVSQVNKRSIIPQFKIKIPPRNLEKIEILNKCIDEGKSTKGLIPFAVFNNPVTFKDDFEKIEKRILTQNAIYCEVTGLYGLKSQYTYADVVEYATRYGKVRYIKICSDLTAFVITYYTETDAKNFLKDNEKFKIIYDVKKEWNTQKRKLEVELPDDSTATEANFNWDTPDDMVTMRAGSAANFDWD